MSNRILERPRAARRRTPADSCPDAALFDPAFVRHFFNQLAPSYAWHHRFDLGLTAAWRRQAVALLPPLPPAATVVDLMCGAGDLWPALRRRLSPTAQVHAVDFAPAMLAEAARRAPAAAATTLHLADALRCPLPSAQADAVVCGFGLKTLPPARFVDLATEVRRLLRPGGRFVLLEFTLPRQGWQRRAFGLYLRLLLPVLIWLSRGRAALHRYLPLYAQAFVNLDAAEGACLAAGFEQVRQVPLLLGCATALVGVKPQNSPPY